MNMEENMLPYFIEDLSNYLTVIKNLSKVYVKNLLVTVEQFLNFINVHTLKNKYKTLKDITLNDIRSIKNSDVYSFIFYLAENHYKTNSRVVKIEHLKTFFKYLYTIKHSIFTEPFKKIKTEKKLEQKLPKYLSLNEAKTLLNVYANSEKTNEIEYNAMLHLFLNNGLRISELANLNISDFNLEYDTFIIRGKGNKERIGYLNKITKNAFEKYLKIRKNIKSKDKDALFLNKYNTRITTRGISKIVKKAYILAGIDEKRNTVHTLRHTCATLMYRSGINIRTIQEMLGHAFIDTTEIYTHLHNQEVKTTMLEFPLAEFKMADALAYCA